jgi:hypothetical protein
MKYRCTFVTDFLYNYDSGLAQTRTFHLTTITRKKLLSAVSSSTNFGQLLHQAAIKANRAAR